MTSHVYKNAYKQDKPINNRSGPKGNPMNLISKVTSKGQITVPQRIRRHLQISKGDRVEFLIGSDGKVTLLPATADVRALKGMVAKPKKKVTIEDMRRAIEVEGGKKA